MKINKYAKITLFVFMFLPLLTISFNFDNDIWFLLNNGKYIVANGFPVNEPFTIHSEMSFVIQQWLFDVIIWCIYSNLGKIGVIGFVFLIGTAFVILTYKTCMLFSNKQQYLSIIITVVSSLIVCMWFMVSRPQIITYLFVLIEIFALEYFLQYKKFSSLLILPIISVLQINFHASMWLMLFIFLTPVLVEEIWNALKAKKITYSFCSIFLVMIIMFLIGFLNPYGKRAMSYIFSSYGNSLVNYTVSEMAVPDIKSFTGFLFFFCVFVISCIFILNKKGEYTIRFGLLTVGTIVLSLMNIKSIPYFVIGSIIPLSFFLKNVASRIKFPDLESANGKHSVIFLSLFLFLILISGLFVIIADYDEKKDYPLLKEAIDFLANSENSEQIVLYTDYYNGGYAEYKGLKCYIDARAEVFLKSLNKNEDIFDEYIKLQNGKMHYKDFIEKYCFTHLLVSSDDALEVYLSRDKKFLSIYEDKIGKIYIPLEFQE